MDLPFKIIYKFKNIHGSKQYFLYLFVGKVPHKIKIILNKITNLSLFDTLKTLDNNELNIIRNFYGKKWYNKLFLSYHINASLNKLKNDTSLQKKYSNLIKGGSSLAEIFGEKKDEDEDIIDELPPDIIDIEPYEKEDEENIIEKKKDIRLFNDLIKKHDKEISDINIIKFDKSKDNIHKDDELSNLFQKKYVYNNYVLIDDTVKTLKERITLSIKGGIGALEFYILPSRMYLWSESANKKYTIIGHKWLKKNELWESIKIVQLDNIDDYYNITEYSSDIVNQKSISSNFIRAEDNNDYILEDYHDLITNNEIFMTDIYNELGVNANLSSEQKNIFYMTYVSIYFPKLKIDTIPDILDFLNFKRKIEETKQETGYKMIKKNIILQQQSINIYQNILINERDKYIKLLKTLYIVQSSSYWQSNLSNLDLYLIFDSFKTSGKIPFAQYQTRESVPIFKLHTPLFLNLKDDERDNYRSWFQSTPYGISFKLKLTNVFDKNVTKTYMERDRYMTILITENGRVECKSQWKEDNKITLDHIKVTINETIKLIKYINSFEDIRNKFSIPSIDEFRFSFINAIQNFEITKDYPKNIINHAELSAFTEFFFPFVSVIFQTSKKHKKDVEKTKKKYGTYLTYKRISKYEYSFQTRLQSSIVNLLKHFHFQNNIIVDKISREFNIPDTQVEYEISQLKKKMSAQLTTKEKGSKSIEQLPTFKTPGIKIDIQGKRNEKYIFRILGARNENQLQRIIDIMNIIIYLYLEIYIKKDKSKLYIKKLLADTTKTQDNINDVEVIYEEATERLNIKNLEELDKKRFGFTPKPGHNNYSRDCGKDKQPQGFPYKQLRDLEALGYYYDETEKAYMYDTVHRKIPNANETKVRLKAIKLKNSSTGDDVYYVCHPDKNGKHIYLGFLDRNNNPDRICMPCCYKNNHNDIKSKFRSRYLECTGQYDKDISKMEYDPNIEYILQDTNKIGHGRIGMLPLQLDILFNDLLNNKKKMKDQHYIESTSGYYFKFGIIQDSNSFLNSIAITFGTTMNSIRDKITELLLGSNGEIVFQSLDNGKLKLLFDKKEKYLENVLINSTYNYKYLLDILSLPTILSKNGVNIFIFERFVEKIIIVDEKTIKKKDDFNMICQNHEESEFIETTKKDNVFFILENDYFFPIYHFMKKSSKDKFKIKKTYNNDEIKHIFEFYYINCSPAFSNINRDLDSSQNIRHVTAKKTLYLIKNTFTEDSEFYPKLQVINNYYRCIYLVAKSNYLIPTYPSGIIYHFKTDDDIDKYRNDFEKTYSFLNKVFGKSGKKINCLPIGVIYKSKTGNSLVVTEIIVLNEQSVPVKHKTITIKELDKMNLKVKKSITSDYNIDNAIISNTKIYDERMFDVNNYNYFEEGYELFRLNFSDFIKRNNDIKKEIMENIKNKLKTKKVLSSLLFKNNNLVYIINKRPELRDYIIQNRRIRIFLIKDIIDIADINVHFIKPKNSRKLFLAIAKSDLNIYIERLSHELVHNLLKRNEILQESSYYVSTIVNRDNVTSHNKEMIIKSDNPNLESIMKEIFKDIIPIVKKSEQELQETQIRTYKLWNTRNPIFFKKPYFIQRIFNEDQMIYRAFANCFFWTNNSHLSNELRNLGYFHPTQTHLANYFKGTVVNRMLNSQFNNNIIENIDKLISKKQLMEKKRKNMSSKEYLIKFAKKMAKSNIPFSNTMIEFFTINEIYEIPIYIHDRYRLINSFIGKRKVVKEKSLYFRLSYPIDSTDNIPNRIDSMYYSTNID